MNDEQRCLYLHDCSAAEGYITVYTEAFRQSTSSSMPLLMEKNAYDNYGGGDPRSGCGADVPVVPPWKLLLQTIAEPMSRPSHVHMYRITPFSLGAAVSAGWSADRVIEELFRFAYYTHDDDNDNAEATTSTSTKDTMCAFIRTCMERYDKVSIVVQADGVFLEVKEETTLKTLLEDASIVSLCAQLQQQQVQHVDGGASMMLNQRVEVRRIRKLRDVNDDEQSATTTTTTMAAQDEQEGDVITYRIRLQDHAAGQMLAEILCTRHGLPICRRYDFGSDSHKSALFSLAAATSSNDKAAGFVRSINMTLKPQCKPRAYQIQAVESAMSSDGTSLKSGVLLLPCGAGKTLVGVLLASVVKKTTIIVCAGSVSVEQWKSQLLEWADLWPLEDDAISMSAAGGEAAAAAEHSSSRGRGRGAAAPPPRMRFASTIRTGKPVGASRIACLTGKQKDPITDDTDVVITTYSMLGVAHQLFLRRARAQGISADVLVEEHSLIGHRGDRRASTQTKKVGNPKEELFRRMWGVVILDEVHMAPAAAFRESISNLAYKSIIGLTATFVREDHRIHDIFFVVGPKLYDVSWEELCRQGYLAQVTCVEVHTTMTPQFLVEYSQRLQLSAAAPVATGTRGGSGESGIAALKYAPVLQLIAAANPNKFLCVEQLVRRHSAHAAKILLFCDHLGLLKEYGGLLRAPVVCGETSLKDRIAVFSEFQTTMNVNLICISRVGDVSVNLPSANVVIQVSSHGGSRRQEAQRLGRILRPKTTSTGGGGGGVVDAFFYSIISKDTLEVSYAAHRTEFLVDQGYRCRLVTFDVAPPPPPSTADDVVVKPRGDSRAAAPPSSLPGGPKGDVAAVKKEELLNQVLRGSRLSMAMSTMYDTITDITWQLRLLASMISNWELQFMRLRSQCAANNNNNNDMRKNKMKKKKKKRTRSEDSDDDDNDADSSDCSMASSSSDADEEYNAEAKQMSRGGNVRCIIDVKREWIPEHRSLSSRRVDDDVEILTHHPHPQLHHMGVTRSAGRPHAATLSTMTVGCDGVVYHELM